MAPQATAVIVTYRSRTTLPHALQAVGEAHRKGLLECVVIDNHSDDGTVEYVRAEHPWARVIVSEENLGFARGCNLGFRHVRTPYVLLLNPDAVLAPDGLSRMIRFLDENRDAGVVGPAVLHPDGSLQLAGGLPTPGRLILRAARWPRAYHERQAIVPGQAPFRTEWLCGSILLVRKQLLDELGGFDPRFFLYFEDDDLCRRALDRGWTIWALGEVQAEHDRAASARATGAPLYSHCIAEHYSRSRFYYLVKHHGWLKAAAAELLELPLLATIDLLRWIIGREASDFRNRVRAPILCKPARDRIGS